MFYHVKDLQYKARVSRPDPRFARLLLEQFGGPNGELKAAMQYFVQAFSCKNPFPDKYDMLMDIATEELGHLEIVGALIQMLLGPVNGEMKDVVADLDVTKMMEGKATKEDYIHQALTNPQFLVLAPGSPILCDSNGNPWSATYVTANAELTVDLRSNIAAESRAKIMYEYLIPFTDDPYVRQTLDFLMTREVAHFQQFEAALDTIQPNFPPGIFQTNPRYSNMYCNMSVEEGTRGPWNQGQSPELDEEWQYIDNTLQHVRETNGLVDATPRGTSRTDKSVRDADEKLAKQRSSQIIDATPAKDMQWDNDKPARRGTKKKES